MNMMTEEKRIMWKITTTSEYFLSLQKLAELQECQRVIGVVIRKDVTKEGTMQVTGMKACTEVVATRRRITRDTKIVHHNSQAGIE